MGDQGTGKSYYEEAGEAPPQWRPSRQLKNLLPLLLPDESGVGVHRRTRSDADAANADT